MGMVSSCKVRPLSGYSVCNGRVAKDKELGLEVLVWPFKEREPEAIGNYVHVLRQRCTTHVEREKEQLNWRRGCFSPFSSPKLGAARREREGHT